ncbi:hypothetical protein [Salinactinospora qingdaonensis]|uniref:Uncharacterized protein n=1 Tax=Salinactinospora qingdaonensis TaxID=702744 RepID=A0ABP7GEU1_9ACTN
MPAPSDSTEITDRIARLVRVAAAQPAVKAMVEDNHDDNRWWPRSVADWRVRMAAAGWSSRISYSMVSTYSTVVHKAAELGWDRLTGLPDEQLSSIVASLGLVRARVDYLRSLRTFLDSRTASGHNLLTTDATSLIGDFARNVRGASYKVAQCAVLYSRDYHCGIIPVDSGMVTHLAPCLGLSLSRGSIAHEEMRLVLQQATVRHGVAIRKVADELGYAVTIPSDTPPTWFTHLVLIYFKRAFLNRANSRLCPRRPLCPTAVDCSCSRT